MPDVSPRLFDKVNSAMRCSFCGNGVRDNNFLQVACSYQACLADLIFSAFQHVKQFFSILLFSNFWLAQLQLA